MHVFKITLTGFALLVMACRPGSIPELPDAASNEFAVLTINLHTYQEFRSVGVAESDLTDELARQRIDSYGPLFDRIADGINQMNPDIVCFQEVGEWSGDSYIVAQYPRGARWQDCFAQRWMGHRLLRRRGCPHPKRHNISKL
jgi:hypothetical protein